MLRCSGKTGVGVESDQCGPTSKCIVAERVLRFVPNSPLVVNVDMSTRCEGIACPVDETCELGQCVSAVIDNPAECEGAGCGGDVLVPADGGAAPVDAGVDATLPSDGSIDATVPGEATTDAGDASDAPLCPGACTSDASQCVSATSVETCEPQAAGCPTWGAATTCVTPAGFGTYACERYGAPSCVDPDWAEWPMPNDSADPGAPNQTSFKDDLDGTVSDQLTGLMWQQTAAPSPEGGPNGQFLPADGAAYCAGLKLAGHDDWRLPSLIELVTLLDLAADPPIDTTFFPGTPSDTFLSSTGIHGTDGSWILDFGSGFTDGTTTKQTNYVRCVR